MNFVADEGVDRQIIERLRADGHRVISVAETSPGSSNDAILDAAADQNALLLTADKDFGELVYRLRRVTAGVILIRLFGVPPQRKAELLSLIVRDHGADLPDAFTIVSSGTVRIRRHCRRPCTVAGHGAVKRHALIRPARSPHL